MIHRRILVAALIVLTPLVASAEAKPTDLDWYIGKWTCQGAEYEGGVVTDRMTATAEMTKVLGGNWIAVRMDFMKSEKGTPQSESSEMRGFDPKRKKWVHVYFVNAAGGYGMAESDGFVGQKMVWTTVATPGNPPPTPAERATIVKLADNRYQFYVEVQTPKGWQKTFEKNCTK